MGFAVDPYKFYDLKTNTYTVVMDYPDGTEDRKNGVPYDKLFRLCLDWKTKWNKMYRDRVSSLTVGGA